MKVRHLVALSFFCLFGINVLSAADTVPTDIQQPGTQPGEVGNLETPDKCDNCHGGYDQTVEPAFNWRGSMMANAGRDPIFWATLAIVEQDFDGAGDLCIRCHSTGGWLGGRSTPTDGSGLSQQDADGVECDFCHKMTNPDNTEHVGVQNPPFVANDGGLPLAGYYGSGMYSLWGGNDKLGPYDNADARHQWMQSAFHRSVDFCGTCHDVSNPAVGDLAHNNGAQQPLDPGSYSGIPGDSVETKAAFNNFPYQYGIVERTFSEFKSGLISETLVSNYPFLPPELQDGALKAGYESAIVAGTNGNYEDNVYRYYSCQTCHLRPVTGTGCDKRGAPLRRDLPLHDMTGGNYWMPDAIKYLDTLGRLRLGGGLDATQLAALDDGVTRAMKQLNEAASLTVEGETVRVVNLTGHKLISGYPEGRRMWLNVKWYDERSERGVDHRSGGSEHKDIRSALCDDPGVGGPTARPRLSAGSGIELRPIYRYGRFQPGGPGGPGTGDVSRDIPLRAEQLRREGQPDPALRDAVRHGGGKKLSASSGRSVRESGTRWCL
jgi:hypothetical protein